MVLGYEKLANKSQKTSPILILFFLLITGTILRFFQIEIHPLWLDEAMTYHFSLNPFLEYWNLISAGGEVHPPLFYWIEWIALQFGNSEFVLRFFPAIFGILSIPLVYCLGRELFDSIEVGLLAAALLTFSPFHIAYSQEARMYSLVTFFSIIALIFYTRAIRTEQLKNWIFFGIFSALTLYTHFYPAIFIGILYLLAFYRKKWDYKQIAISLGLLSIILLPLIPIALQLFTIRTAGIPTWGLSGLQFILSTLVKYSFSSIIGLFILFPLFIVAIIEKRNEDFRYLAFGLAMVLIISIALASYMPMVERYVLFLTPIYYVGIAGTYSLFKKEPKEGPKTKIIFPILIVWIFLLSSPGLIGYYTTGEQYDWRGAAGYLSDHETEFDTLYLMPGYNSVPLEYYYMPVEIEIGKVSTIQDLNISSLDSRDFIVYTSDVQATDKELMKWLNENSTPVWKGSGIIIATISQGEIIN